MLKLRAGEIHGVYMVLDGSAFGQIVPKFNILSRSRIFCVRQKYTPELYFRVKDDSKNLPRSDHSGAGQGNRHDAPLQII